jgi:hypothetical protein
MATTIFGGALNPYPSAAIGDFGSAASDIFAGFGDQSKAQGDHVEGANYALAAK